MQQSPPNSTIRVLLIIAGLTSAAWFSLALIAFVSFRALVNSSVEVSHSANRLDAALGLQASILRAQREVREYILAPVPQQLTEYRRQSAQVNRDLEHLEAVVQEEALLQSQVEALMFLAKEKQRQSDEFIAQVQQVGPERATEAVVQSPLLGQASITDSELQNLISSIQTKELILQREKEGALQRNLVVASATMAAGALLGILTLGGSVWVAIGEIQRRARINLELTAALDSAIESSCLLENRPNLEAANQEFQSALENLRNPRRGAKDQ